MVAPEITAAKSFFKERVGHTPSHVQWVPGRLDLLGVPATPVQGLVMGCATHRGLGFAFSPRMDGKVELHDERYPQPCRFWLTQRDPDPGMLWADPVKRMLSAVSGMGLPVGGFTAAWRSGLPWTVDLGQEEALELATALAIRELHPFRLTLTGPTVPPRRDARGRLPVMTAHEQLPMARLCQRARDGRQRSTSLARWLIPLGAIEGHLVVVDTRFDSLEWLDLVGEVLVVCHVAGTGGLVPSGPPAADLERVWAAGARAGLQAMGHRSVRSLEHAEYRRLRGRLESGPAAVLDHTVDELQLVVFAERAMRDDDHGLFGRFLGLSHDSLRDRLRCGGPAWDRLRALAVGHGACLGARKIGAAAGGAMVCLVRHHLADPFLAHLRSMDGMGLLPGDGRLESLVLMPAAGLCRSVRRRG